jgi:hypothetical protein
VPGSSQPAWFGYQLGFIRLFNRLPAQQPFEVTDEIVTFVGVQLGIDRTLIADYSNHRDAISDHQIRIRDYLKPHRLGEVEMQNLEAFLFEEACRLEHTAALQARVQNYLKAQRILLPAESTLIRIIGEQRQRARERIYERITADLPGKVAGVLDELLQVPLGEKASPCSGSKPIRAIPHPKQCWRCSKSSNSLRRQAYYRSIYRGSAVARGYRGGLVNRAVAPDLEPHQA